MHLHKLAPLSIALLFLVAACVESADRSTGPQGLPVAATLDGDPNFPANSDLCGTYTGDPDTDFSPPDAGDLHSPCDGAHLDSAPQEPTNTLTASVFFLPSFVGEPSVPLTNFSGVESLLSGRVVPYTPTYYEGGTGDLCQDRATEQGLDPAAACAARSLTFTEVEDGATGSKYSSSFKTAKKGKPGLVVPSETYWQIIVLFDIDQSESIEADEDAATRIVKITDDPSSDIPNDAWSRDVQRGSNVPIDLVLNENDGNCLGTASGTGTVECLVNLAEGGELTLNNTRLVLGAGSEGGLTLVTGTTTCDLTPSDELDIPTYGACRKFFFEPALEPGEKLKDSCILYESADVPPEVEGDGAVTVHMIDEDGAVALPPVSDCTPQSAHRNGLERLWNKLAGFFGATPAVATSAAVSHGSSGGSLDDFRVGSDFIIARPTWALPKSSLKPQVAPGQTTQVEVEVFDHLNDGVNGATVHFFADDATGGAVNCPASSPCVQVSPTHIAYTTESDYPVATADWTIGFETTKLWALGCGIAVDVLDPANEYPDGTVPQPVSGSPDYFPSGDKGLCDRDPSDVEGDPTANFGGYPNGPEGDTTTPITDGLIPGVYPNDAPDTPVWLNDLPIEFEAKVCSAPTPDGIKGADEWDPACVESTTFPVEISGDPREATLYWFNDLADLFLAVSLPASDGEQNNTTVTFEFDLGDGDLGPDNQASVNDDLLVFTREKVKGQIEQIFSDRHLDETCANSSAASICDAVDEGQDLIGGIEFNADADAEPGYPGFIFYEGSHPLCSGELQDFCLEAGQYVGMFIRLAIGNSKSGRNVWPDHRLYENPDGNEPGPPLEIK